jgi:hypothetical protein
MRCAEALKEPRERTGLATLSDHSYSNPYFDTTRLLQQIPSC